MAHQTNKNRAVKVPAEGDAPNTGAPGPTPAPVKTYKNPDLEQMRVFQAGYGTNSDNSPSSLAPGTSKTSSLADELKRVNALGDQGDHLQDIISHGVARNSSVDLASPQTRDVSKTPYPAAHGMRSRQADSGSPGGQVPDKCGAPVSPLPKEPS
jgi:hypothetical protein